MSFTTIELILPDSLRVFDSVVLTITGFLAPKSLDYAICNNLMHVLNTFGDSQIAYKMESIGQAIIKGDAEVVEWAFQNNKISKDNIYPLLIDAISFGHLNIIEVLARNCNSDSPDVYNAILKSIEWNKKDCVMALVEYCGDEFVVMTFDHLIKAGLHDAAEKLAHTEISSEKIPEIIIESLRSGYSFHEEVSILVEKLEPFSHGFIPAFKLIMSSKTDKDIDTVLAKLENTSASIDAYDAALELNRRDLATEIMNRAGSTRAFAMLQVAQKHKVEDDIQTLAWKCQGTRHESEAAVIADDVKLKIVSRCCCFGIVKRCFRHKK